MLQVYKRMFQGMFTLGFGEGAGSTESPVYGIANSQLGDFIRNNKDQIKSYFQQLDGGNGIDINDVNNSAQKKFDTNRLLKELGLAELDASGQKLGLKNALNAVDNYETGVANVVTKTHAQQATHRENVVNQQGLMDLETTSYTESDLSYGVTTDEYATVSNERLGDKTDLSSLESFLRDTSPSELSAIATNLPDAATSSKSDFRKVLGKTYDNKGWSFDRKERVLVEKAIDYYHDMNTKAAGLPIVTQINSLLDFDKDMVVGNKRVAFAGEAQMRELIMKEPNGYSNLLANLGIPLNHLDGNFFYARERFQTALNRAVATGILPSVLVEKDKMAEFVAEQFRLQQAVNKKVEERLLSDPRFANLDSNIFDAVKLEAVGVVLGQQHAAGATFNIEKATAGILDHISLGYGKCDGKAVPGIAISKRVHNGKRIKVDVGAGGALTPGVKFVPFINVAGDIIKPDVKLDRLFDQDIKGKVSLSGYINISHKLSGGIVLGKATEKNSAGIHQMIEKMDASLDAVLASVEKGEGFDTARLSYEGDSDADRAVYNEILGLYQRTGKNPAYLSSIKSGYMASYRASLYDNAEGYKLTGVGLSFLAGHFPIPTIHGEHIKSSYHEEKAAVGSAAAERVSRRAVTGPELGADENFELNGYKTLFIPNIEKAFVCPGVQVVEVNGGVAISGDLRGRVVTVTEGYRTQSRTGRILNIGARNFSDTTELTFKGVSTDAITSNVIMDSGELEKSHENYVPLSQLQKPAGEGWEYEIGTKGFDIPAGDPVSVPEGQMHIQEYVSESTKMIISTIDNTVGEAWIGKEGAPTLMAEFQNMLKASKELSETLDLSESNIDRIWKFLVENMLGDASGARSPSSWAGKTLPGELQKAGVLDTVLATTDRREKLIIMDAIMNALRRGTSTMTGTITDGRNLTELSTIVATGSVNTRFDVFSSELAKTTGIAEHHITTAQSAYLNLPVYDEFGRQVVDENGMPQTMGDMKTLKTAYVYEASNSITAAAQLNKNGVKGGVSLHSGAQEYVVDANGNPIEVPMLGLSNTEIQHRKQKLSKEYLSTVANEINMYLGVNLSSEDIRSHLLAGTSIAGNNGKSVTLDYTMSYALTGNCFNDHLREKVIVNKTAIVAGEAGGFQEETGRYVRKTTGQQYYKSTTSTRNLHRGSVISGVAGINADGGGNEDENGSTLGEDTGNSSNIGEGGTAQGGDVPTGNSGGPLGGPLGQPEVITPGPISNPPRQVNTGGNKLPGMTGYVNNDIGTDANDNLNQYE